jgi:MFS family permease
MTMIPDANSPDRLNLVVRVVAFLLVFGIGYGGTIPVSLALMADFFGRRSYATIQGWSSMVTMLGNVIGPTLAGYVFDVSQSYEIALISFAIATVAGMPLFWLVRRPALRPAAATGGV